MSRTTTQLGRRTRVLRIRLLGIAFFVVVALFVWVCIAFYNKTFTSVTKVSLVTDTIGNALPQNADVKVRGLTVGYVKSSHTDNGKVTLQLNLKPDKARLIPSNVTARLLPKTLFGERYVVPGCRARPNTAEPPDARLRRPVRPRIQIAFASVVLPFE